MAKNDKAAKAEMKASRRALDKVGEKAMRTGNREEAAEYLASNRRVIEAQKGVS